MVSGCRVDMTVSSMVLMRLFRGSLVYGCAHSTVRCLAGKLIDNIVKLSTSESVETAHLQCLCEMLRGFLSSDQGVYLLENSAWLGTV